MAAALIGGLLRTGTPASALHIAEPLAERRDWLRTQFGVPVVEHAGALPATQVLVLAVKPQQIAEAIAALKPAAGTVVISIVAGLRLATLRRLLGSSVQLVRTMPNTPALLGAGVTGLFAPADTTPEARALTETLLAAAGVSVWVETEDQLDAVTALSGSGPAYFFRLVEVLRDAGAALGLPPAVAATLAQHTCLGAARMLAESGRDAGTLRAQVTSKGGTTEAALQSLDRANLAAIFANALAAADARAKALGDALDRPV